MLCQMACVYAGSEDLNAQFSIEPIAKDSASQRFNVSISIPSAVSGSSLLMCFYTEGVLTGTTAFDSSSAKSFSQRVKYNVSPDEIKLFMWQKGALKPIKKAQSVVTPELIEYANAEVVELLNAAPAAINHIRYNWILETDTDIIAILDKLQACVDEAKPYADTHLLTSLFVRDTFKEELTEIQRLRNESDTKQMDKLESIILNDMGEHYETVEYLISFLDIKLIK